MPELTLPPYTSNDSPAYFGDPMLDRFAAALVETLARVWVLHDRVRTLEQVLANQGVISKDALLAYSPSDAETDEIRTERDAFIRGVLERLATG
ncbi:MAG: hypothetical protein U0556_13620 [Dehalococcoidia bacterium]